MARRASLYDGCPTSHALDLIGDRWALLVVRELLLGPKRFTDLRRGLPRISPNVLSQRLDDLEAAAVLSRRTLPPPAASSVFELTDRGLELESVLKAVGRWGAGSPLLPASDQIGTDTFVLSLRAHFEPAKAEMGDVAYELQVDDAVFTFEVQGGRLTVRRGPPDRPHPVLAIEPEAMASVARGDLPLRRTLAPVGATLQRDIDAFARLFRRPRRSAATAGRRD